MVGDSGRVLQRRSADAISGERGSAYSGRKTETGVSGGCQWGTGDPLGREGNL
jgi:hypothetical protein